MKFTINKNIIVEALSNAVRALSTKITIPVLNGILLNLTNDGLEVQASDSELTIKTTIEAKNIVNIEKEGRAVLQSRCLLEIIRKMPSEIINFELTDNNNIKIYSDINEYIIECYNIGEYPNIALEKSQNTIYLESKILKEMINQTSYAMSMQEVRPLLTGLNLKINGDILECTATDSYRLSKKTVKLKDSINSNINIVIPGKSVNELVYILKDEGNVEIDLFKNKVLFHYNNILFQTALLNGTYPDTSNYIPKDFNYMINLNLKEFYSAIDRASTIMVSKDKNIIKMVIDNKKMTLFAASSDSKSKEELTIDSNNKEKLEISYSSKYMLDALKVLDSENIILLINGDDKPIIINSVDDDTIIELILPKKTYKETKIDKVFVFFML